MADTISIIVLLVFGMASCLATTNSSKKWTEMRVKYGATADSAGVSAFWDVPRTLAAALDGEWELVVVENRLGLTAVGASQEDKGFTPFYDSNGILAGAQIAVPLSDIVTTGPPSFIPTRPGTNEVVSIDGKLFLASTFLIRDPQELVTGQLVDPDADLGTGLWLRDTTLPSGYRRVPTDLDQVVSDTLFTWQNCFPSMGKHYFYNQTAEADCNDFYSWFLLGQDDDVTGIGYQIFGKTSYVTKNWWDEIGRSASMTVVPITNECFYDWVEIYGVISIHIYFTSEPWNISCVQAVDSVSPIPGLP